jgi:hypothetical protein
MQLGEDYDIEGHLDAVLAAEEPSGGPVLRTPAWYLIGLTRSLPGALQLVGSRLTLATEFTPLFDEPLAAIERVTWPWWYFGGGCKIRVGGEGYRVSFVRPNGAMDTSTRVVIGEAGAAGAGAALDYALVKMRDVHGGRARGRAWREVLDAALATNKA